MLSHSVLIALAAAAVVNGAAIPAKRETWVEWGSAIGNVSLGFIYSCVLPLMEGQHYANLYGSPDNVPGLPHYKRSPEPMTWGEWGSAIGYVLSSHIRLTITHRML